MKAYFTASIVGKKLHLADYIAIVQALKNLKYTVTADHILNTRPEDLGFETSEERHAFHEKLEAWIRTSDIFVANTSFPSISVGYEISMALHFNKPVLLLHHTSVEAPSLLIDYKTDEVLCEAYTRESLSTIIADFVNYAKSKAESRFTFFITPEISSYLSRVAKKNKIPKSVYLRQLIEKDMKSS